MAITIVKQNRDIEKLFCKLNKGDTFEHLGDFYMKINEVSEDASGRVLNSVNLATGSLAWYSCTAFVKPVDVELTVMEENDYADILNQERILRR